MPRLALRLPQHPDEHRPEGPILLAVDQELGEGAALWVTPELADPVGPLKVGEHEDVEQLGAGSRTEGLQALPEAALELIGTQRQEATPSDRLVPACPPISFNAGVDVALYFVICPD